MVEDLGAFFADFAVNATVGSSSVPAIFDREHVEAMGGFGGGIDSAVPVCLMKSTDVTGHDIEFGTAIVLPGGERLFGNVNAAGDLSYVVRSVRHDGTGMCTLVLEEG